MLVSDQRIQTFRELYKKRHGVELSYEEAKQQANTVMSLVRSVLTKDKHDDENKNNYDNQTPQRNNSEGN